MALFLKNLLFVLILPGTVGVYVPLLLARGRVATSGLLFVLACALLAVGVTLFAWCLWDFAVFGRGTPAPIDPPKRLVVRGLYRYTRNPIYVSALMVVLGWAVMFLTPALFIYAICLAFGFHLFVVFYEEPHLRRQFGAEYEDYCAKVGRWLPRLS